MAKNLFFFDIKNNAIVESNVDDVSKLNNSDIIQINYDSKNPNNKKNLIENIQRIINNYNLDNNFLDNHKTLYANDRAICLVDNNKIVCYGDNKYGGNCLYNILNPTFIIPTVSRFISNDSNNIYVWGTLNYTFNDANKYLRISYWNIVVNKNDTHFVFKDNKNKLIQVDGYNVKSDSLNELFSINKPDEIMKYIKLFIMKKIFDKVQIKNVQ